MKINQNVWISWLGQAKGLEQLGFWIEAPTGVDSSSDLFPSRGGEHSKVLKGEGMGGNKGSIWQFFRTVCSGQTGVDLRHLLKFFFFFSF